MKWIVLCFIVAFMLVAWQVAAALSPDAVAMAVGMLFGVLATIPVALLVMASNRHNRNDDCGLPALREPPAPVVVIYSNRTNNNTIIMTPKEAAEAEELYGWQPSQRAELTRR